MKQRFIDYYMDIAERTALLSRAIRLKVGSILVKDNKIISIGFNGTPAGWDNECENSEYADDGFRVTLTTKPEVIHAEANAISKLARCHESGNESVMFITHAPCMECAKLIYGAGIKQVFYRTAYRSSDGIDFLNKCNVEVIQYEKRT